MIRGLGTNLPVYVTRRSADGYTGTYYLSAWMPLLAILIVWLNVVCWGAYGLYLVGRLVVV